MQKFALLIARQRSGTGALGSVLHQHLELDYLGEIFHPDNEGQPLNFFTRLRELAARDASYALPDRRAEVLDYFLAKLEEDGRKGLPIIDVKYRSLHHLNGGWHGQFDVPRIIQIARENSFPIIHLKRSNFVETFVSGLLADRNKIWHARSTDTIKHTSVRVKKAALERYLKATTREVMWVDAWLRNYDRVVECEYADMFDDGDAISNETCERIASAFSIGSFDRVLPALVKQAPRDLSASIENFAEIKREFSNTEFFWMMR